MLIIDRKYLEVAGLIGIFCIYPLVLLGIDIARFVEIDLYLDLYAFEKLSFTSAFLWLFFIPQCAYLGTHSLKDWKGWLGGFLVTIFILGMLGSAQFVVVVVASVLMYFFLIRDWLSNRQRPRVTTVDEVNFLVEMLDLLDVNNIATTEELSRIGCIIDSLAEDLDITFDSNSNT